MTLTVQYFPFTVVTPKANDKIIPVPKWVTPFLEHYEKSKKYDHLIKEVFKVVKVLEKDKIK